MVQSNPTVVELRSSGRDRAQERALAAVHRHLREAQAAIDAVLAGDVDMVFTAHREVGRAMGVTLDNRLYTGTWPSCPTCSTCGAEVSYGRCWGCGLPPERAS